MWAAVKGEGRSFLFPLYSPVHLISYPAAVLFHEFRTTVDVWCAQYNDWEMSREDLVAASRRNIVEFLEDAFYVAPITQLALLHATAPPPPPASSVVSSTFFYVLNYSTAASIPDMLAYSLGAALTDGIDPFSTDVVYSPADKLLAEIVLNYWSNFIRTGYISTHILGECDGMRQKAKLIYDTEKNIDIKQTAKY